jgi:hypothetical protein
MSTTTAKTLSEIADQLDAAIAALPDLRGQTRRREREEAKAALGRIAEIANRAADEVGRKPLSTKATDGFDTENEWSDLIARIEFDES